MEEQKIRIGIDVGGTFTHAVAVDHKTFKVIAHSVTPTTHSAELSVSEGIIKTFRDVIAKSNTTPENVVFVAHSTTQATNALLEGDVAKVGIIGMGKGIEGIKAKIDTTLGDIELSKDKYLYTSHCFFDTTQKDFTEKNISEAILKLKEDGCGAIAAAEAFSVDDSKNENIVAELSRGICPLAQSCEISQLYGLKVRTRTAVINASILPKMTQTAKMTDESIKKSGITAPLMIMRSDGGVMDIAQMEKRPILTMLSGPAAGIAAALMFAKISDGIFLEVGGTSTDIAAIKDGKAMVKSAQVGGHITYLKTLDSRTVGIGGGSMIRIKGKKIYDVGPRSAHIAGLPYIAFSSPEDIKDIKPVFISPYKGDPDDFIVFENISGKRFALTLTDTALYAGYIKETDYAFGNMQNVQKAFAVLSEYLGVSAKEIAAEILDIASAKVESVVEQLLDEYKLDRNLLVLAGGGGGAASVVPYLGHKMKMKHTIVESAEVISAIGAALAMLRDSVERSVIDPSEEDFAAIKSQAENSLISMGADINTIEVQISYDQQKSVLSAVATGSIHMDGGGTLEGASDEQIFKKATESFGVSGNEIRLAEETSGFRIFQYAKTEKKLFGLIKNTKNSYRVLDNFGIVKLQISDGYCGVFNNVNIEKQAEAFIKEISDFNDAGIIVPQIYMLYSGRIADFSTIVNFEQIMRLIKLEAQNIPSGEKIVLLSRIK